MKTHKEIEKLNKELQKAKGTTKKKDDEIQQLKNQLNKASSNNKKLTVLRWKIPA